MVVMYYVLKISVSIIILDYLPKSAHLKDYMSQKSKVLALCIERTL